MSDDIEAGIEKLLPCIFNSDHGHDEQICKVLTCPCVLRHAVIEFCRGLVAAKDARIEEEESNYIKALDRGDEWARKVGPLEAKIASLESKLAEARAERDKAILYVAHRVTERDAQLAQDHVCSTTNCNCRHQIWADILDKADEESAQTESERKG